MTTPRVSLAPAGVRRPKRRRAHGRETTERERSPMSGFLHCGIWSPGGVTRRPGRPTAPARRSRGPVGVRRRWPGVLRHSGAGSDVRSFGFDSLFSLSRGWVPVCESLGQSRRLGGRPVLLEDGLAYRKRLARAVTHSWAFCCGSGCSEACSSGAEELRFGTGR